MCKYWTTFLHGFTISNLSELLTLIYASMHGGTRCMRQIRLIAS